MIAGLDMGGTHIDGVIIENGNIISAVKIQKDEGDIFESVWEALQKLLAGQDKSRIKRINLSTTVSTNAIIEDKISSVGMIIQRGPGLTHDFSKSLNDHIFISGSIDHRGKIVEELRPKEIEAAREIFKNKGLGTCGVVTKFSTRNFDHELRIKHLLGKGFEHISMGHTLSGMLNFPRRVYSTYLNAAVYKTFYDFALSIKKALIQEDMGNIPIFVLKADGGTSSLPEAVNKPVETILSGPAASFLGLRTLFDTHEDALLLDIGGTTTDIFFLSDGIPLFEPFGIDILSYKTLIRSIYSVSMGLGGDSSIKTENQSIVIGPNRDGFPYALGGPSPTPSDAMIALGMIETGERQRAAGAMKTLGDNLGLPMEEAAHKVIDTMGDMIKSKVDKLIEDINEQPVYTIKELLEGKRLKPRLINLIGGPAKCLSPTLEKKFNLPCYYPKEYAIANALGAAMARITEDITLTADTQRGLLTAGEFGVSEKIHRGFTLKEAKSRAIDLLTSKALAQGAEIKDVNAEIIEESSFNMVEGFNTVGKNIRVKAQIKPGIISF